jgi:hypothetical protein
MKDWICLRCGQEVLAADRPAPINWTDGHICNFTENHTYETKYTKEKNTKD